MAQLFHELVNPLSILVKDFNFRSATIIGIIYNVHETNNTMKNERSKEI